MKTKNPTGSRIDEWRTAQGLTLQDLATHTGLTKGYLSKIIRAANPPPFSTLQKIASALNVDVTELLPLASLDESAHDIDFFPAKARKSSSHSGGVCEFKTLLKSYRNKKMSPFIMRIHPGATEEFRHDAEEFVYVLHGEVEMRYAGRRYSLKTGDCFYLDSRIGHTFTNGTQQPVDLLAVDFNYREF